MNACTIFFIYIVATWFFTKKPKLISINSIILVTLFSTEVGINLLRFFILKNIFLPRNLSDIPTKSIEWNQASESERLQKKHFIKMLVH